MKALVQRVREAAVTADGRTVGAIGAGLLVFVCVEADDAEAQADWMARKVAQLRIFPDEQGRMNRSVADIGGRVLAVSQFTLCADVRRGNRPDFTGAARPESAMPLFDRFCAKLAQQGIGVERGEFGARMAVSLVNDGPVTIWIASPA